MRTNDDLIGFLEGKLEEHSRNIELRHLEYEKLNTEYTDLHGRFHSSR